jgi:tight adherence protein B
VDYLFLTFVVIGFLAVVLLFEGGYLFWNSYRGQDARRLQRRLQALSAAGHASHESEILKQRLLGNTPALEQLLLRFPRVHHLDKLLLQSGVQLTVSTFLFWSAAAAFGGLILWLLARLPGWTAPAIVAAIAAAPLIHVLRARRQRLQAIEQQLPDALELMARALRAGHAFLSALQMVGTEGPEPIAQEFRTAFDEVNYGVPMQDALMNLALRVPVTDLRFFVIAATIQRETGGNLAELLDKLGALIRARFKLLGTIRVLSAEGKLSAWILSLLPFALVAVINLVNPQFMSVLWRDPAGIKLVIAGLAFMVVGIFWMWRIIKIRV